MDGASPSGFTDTPIGTAVGDYAVGTKYTGMGGTAYAPTVKVVPEIRQLPTDTPTKDI